MTNIWQLNSRNSVVLLIFLREQNLPPAHAFLTEQYLLQ